LARVSEQMAGVDWDGAEVKRAIGFPIAFNLGE
jgi:hypothetical protein